MLDKQHPAPRKTRLMLVDDEPSVRRGLRLLFESEPDMEVCGEAGTQAEALDRILAVKPDLALVDLGLKQGSGFNLIKQFRQRCPEVKILVFSMYDQVHFVAAAFAAGADGYVTKAEGTDTALEAIRQVMAGKPYTSEEIRAKLPHLLPAPRPTDTHRRF